MHQGTHLSESEQTPDFPNKKSDLTIQKIEILKKRPEKVTVLLRGTLRFCEPVNYQIKEKMVTPSKLLV